MQKLPGDTFGFRFTVQSSTGASVNADTLPTAVMIRNGALDSTPVITITNISTGVYMATGTIPSSYVAGDEVQIQISATVAGISSVQLRAYDTIDTQRTGQVYSEVGVGGSSLTNLGDARIANLDATVSSRSTYAGTDTPGVSRLLALAGDNQGIRNETYDANNNPLSYDICGYDTAAHASLNDGSTGLIYKWTVTNTFTSNNLGPSNTQRIT